MATFTQNGVSFTAVKGLITPAGKLSNGNNGTYSDANTDGVESFINAVEIDWNSGKVSQATSKAVSTAITTTGELLGVIRGLADRITALENAMVTVSNGLVASLS